ncbi:MAG: hypothetical protein ACRBK7_10800 [Acidimicrobiales bacterium]
MRPVCPVLMLMLACTSCGLIAAQAENDAALLIARCLQVPEAAVTVNVGEDGLADIEFLVPQLGGRQFTDDEFDKCIKASGLDLR